MYLDFGRKGKLSLRYIGPYEILEFIMSFMCPCCEIPDSSYILQEQHIEIEERLDLWRNVFTCIRQKGTSVKNKGHLHGQGFVG